MKLRKKTREKGKIKLSRAFQKLEKGDRVSVDLELSEQTNLLHRYQGRGGVVEGRRGKAYIVKIKDNNKEKIFIINPVHLKKLK